MRNWTDDWAIFFRILISDDAGRNRLRDIATQVEWRLEERLDFQGMGVLPYFNFRTESEQALLREEAWM